MTEPLRKIVRFYQDGRTREVIERGLTLEEAQAHCSRPDTRGEGWFDGHDLDDNEATQDSDA